MNTPRVLALSDSYGEAVALRNSFSHRDEQSVRDLCATLRDCYSAPQQAVLLAIIIAFTSNQDHRDFLLGTWIDVNMPEEAQK